MAPEFPKTFPLKKDKCPECKEVLGAPALSKPESVVRVVCQKDECGYQVELAWIGDHIPSAN